MGARNPMLRPINVFRLTRNAELVVEHVFSSRPSGWPTLRTGIAYFGATLRHNVWTTFTDDFSALHHPTRAVLHTATHVVVTQSYSTWCLCLC